VVGDFLVYGATASEAAVNEVLSRMAEAKADLIPELARLVDAVVDQVVNSVASGATDIVVALGTNFHLGEYLEVGVRIERVFNTYPPLTSRVVGVRLGCFFKRKRRVHGIG